MSNTCLQRSHFDFDFFLFQLKTRWWKVRLGELTLPPASPSVPTTTHSWAPSRRPVLLIPLILGHLPAHTANPSFSLQFSSRLLHHRPLSDLPSTVSLAGFLCLPLLMCKIKVLKIPYSENVSLLFGKNWEHALYAAKAVHLLPVHIFITIRVERKVTYS